MMLQLSLPAQMVIAYALPRSLWPAYASVLVWWHRIVSPREYRALVSKLTQVLGDHVAIGAPARIAKQNLAMRHESRLEHLRLLGPGRWTPTVALSGSEHLDAALAQGQGAILWFANFAGGNVPLKMALHRHGYAVSHLSGARHGIAHSRLGIRFINPIWLRVEMRYLRERVVMTDANQKKARRSLVALRKLRRRLDEKSVVSITALVRQHLDAQVTILNGSISLPFGAARLAYDCGAPLLPVLTFRAASGVYHASIEPPIPIDRSLSSREASLAAVVQYCALLEAHVTKYPAQWQVWRFVEANVDGGTSGSGDSKT
jgi:lauroyl/myristoyl acyltransferase